LTVLAEKLTSKKKAAGMNFQPLLKNEFAAIIS
jgi:hypothetical protein